MDAKTFEEEMEKALSEVIDPETGLSVMRMDLIHELHVDGEGHVSLVFRPSSPVCPMAYALAGSIKRKIQDISGVNSVRIMVENFDRAEHLQRILNT